MKFLIAVCLFAGGFALARAQNLLSNGDFANDGAGWSGDISTSDDGFSKQSAGPVIVKLNADHATRVYERFRSSESNLNNLTFSLTCTPSSDCQFTGLGQIGKAASDMKPVVTYTPGPLGGRNPGSDEYFAKFENATMMLLDPQNNEMEHAVLKLNPAIAQPQTLTCRAFIMAAQREESILYIAFPPGQGSITLNKVSLVKGSPMEASLVNTASPASDRPNAIVPGAWTGDTLDPNADGVDALASSLGNDQRHDEVIVHLHPSQATQINQKINVPPGDLALTLVCTPAAKIEITPPSGNVLFTVGDVLHRFANSLSDTASPASDSTDRNKFMASLRDAKFPVQPVTLIFFNPSSLGYSTHQLFINLQQPNQQTASFHFPSQIAHEETVMLAFPAGHGTVTVNHVYLEPTPAGPPPAP